MNFATGDLAIAICDRCKFKFKYLELSPDRDKPGLRVCDECNDVRDPYRLPPRQPEPFTLRHPRPDESIATTAAQLEELEDFREGVTLRFLQTEKGKFFPVFY